MDYLYAPWRLSYVTKKPSPDTCVFCEQIKSINEDEKYFILLRGKHAYATLNLFPYNSGHVLVLPYKHTGELTDLTDEERNEIMSITTKIQIALKEELRSDGFNIGCNIGAAGGGGIPQHLHMHILPRWAGDANFLTTIGETKAINAPLETLYTRIKNRLLLKS